MHAVGISNNNNKNEESINYLNDNWRELS